MRSYLRLHLHINGQATIKEKFETALSSRLYEKHFRNLKVKESNLLGNECIVDWLLHDIGLRHERVKRFYLYLKLLQSNTISLTKKLS